MFINRVNINKKNLLKILLIIMLGLTVLPYLMASFYCIPSSDDFTNANFIREELESHGYFYAAMKKMGVTHMNWQGTYFGTFLTYFLSAYMRGGLIGAQITYFVTIVLFVFSICVFFYSILKYSFRVSNITFSLMCTFIFLVTSTFISDTSEIFYWLTGLCMYTIPLICVFLSISFLHRAIEKKHSIIFAGILGFFAAGGTLQITAFICYYLLIYVLICYFKKKDVVKSGGVFLITLFGALINATAPGNFVRHGAMSSEYYLLGSIVNTTYSAIKTIYAKATDNMSIFLFIIVFLGGIYLAKRNKLEYKLNPLFLLILLPMMLIVVNFPVNFGFSGKIFPSRCLFIEDTTLTLAIILFALYFGGWIQRRLQLKFTWEVKLIISIIFVFATTNALSERDLKMYIPISIMKEVSDGNLQASFNEYRDILYKLEQEKNQKIVLEKLPGQPRIYNAIGLAEDENYWVNQAIAKYFGNVSIEILEKEY